MPILPRYIYGGYDNCYYNNNGTTSCYNGWYNWGRWVLLGVIILAALLIFFLFSCITARRRRRMGYQPYRGTAWTLGRTPPGHGAAQYNPQTGYQQPQYNNSNNPAPPAYSAPPAGGYYNRETELQAPENTYKPPQGPPPGRI